MDISSSALLICLCAVIVSGLFLFGIKYRSSEERIMPRHMVMEKKKKKKKKNKERVLLTNKEEASDPEDLQLKLSRADPWSPPPTNPSVSSPPVVDPCSPALPRKLPSTSSQPKPPPPPVADPCRSMDRLSPHLSSSDLDEFDIITNREKPPMNNDATSKVLEYLESLRPLKSAITEEGWSEITRKIDEMRGFVHQPQRGQSVKTDKDQIAEELNILKKKYRVLYLENSILTTTSIAEALSKLFSTDEAQRLGVKESPKFLEHRNAMTSIHNKLKQKRNSVAHKFELFLPNPDDHSLREKLSNTHEKRNGYFLSSYERGKQC